MCRSHPEIFGVLGKHEKARYHFCFLRHLPVPQPLSVLETLPCYWKPAPVCWQRAHTDARASLCHCSKPTSRITTKNATATDTKASLSFGCPPPLWRASVPKTCQLGTLPFITSLCGFQHQKEDLHSSASETCFPTLVRKALQWHSTVTT